MLCINTTLRGQYLILRKLYERYLCHNNVATCFQNCTNTIKKCLFKDILFVGPFPIVIPIVNSISNLDHKRFINLNFLCSISAPKHTIKKENKQTNQPTCLGVFNKKITSGGGVLAHQRNWKIHTMLIIFFSSSFLVMPKKHYF